MKIVTRADDFGVSPGTNRAVLDAVDGGFIKNVGVIAPSAHWQGAVPELLSRADRISLGVHATLTSEWKLPRWRPLLGAGKVPSLCLPDGSLPRDTAGLHKRFRLSELEAEVRAQIACLRDKDLRPGYLDTHMVFDWLPGAKEALSRICSEEGLLYHNIPQHAVFDCPLEDIHREGGLGARLEAFQVKNPGVRAVWIFHPADPDPGNVDMPAKVRARRQWEAKILRQPHGLVHQIRDAGAVLEPYVVDSAARS
jgi:hypothetical protein